MYSDIETQTSYEYLQKIVSILEEPICLIGGWAVFLTVNSNYQKRFQKPYIGSKDIDLGFHLEEKWTKKELQSSSFARALKRLESDGYENVGFRVVKHLDRETGKPLTKTEQFRKPLYDQFDMFIDLMIDNPVPAFKETFHMNPIDEPLLKYVFATKENRVELNEFDRKLCLPAPVILVATKLKALPGRNKEHKRIKDIHDIIALLLFSNQNKKIYEEIDYYLSKTEIEKTLNSITKEEKELVKKTIRITGNEIESALTNLKNI